MLLVYKDPAKKNLQKLELATMIIFIIVAVVIGVPAYKDHQAYCEAYKMFETGHSLIHAHREAEAAQCFRKCLEIHPGVYPAYQELSAYYFLNNELDKAVEIDEKAVEQFPRDAVLHQQFAETLFIAQQYTKAIEEAKRAKELGLGEQRSDLLIGACQKKLADPQSQSDKENQVYQNLIRQTRAQEHADCHEHEEEEAGHHHEH